MNAVNCLSDIFRQYIGRICRSIHVHNLNRSECDFLSDELVACIYVFRSRTDLLVPGEKNSANIPRQTNWVNSHVLTLRVGSQQSSFL